MAMENVHNRLRGEKAASRNYIREAWGAMVRKVKQGVEKAESDKTRTQFWLTAAMLVLMPFFSWLGVHLVNFGAQQARQEMFDQKEKGYLEKIAEQNKLIEALRTQPASNPVKPETQTTPQRTRQRQRRSRIQGQANNAPVANTYANMRYPR